MGTVCSYVAHTIVVAPLASREVWMPQSKYSL